MTDSMIERVARAICAVELDGYQPTAHPRGWDDISQSRRKDFIDYARAAIAAMREPTDLMGYAGACHDRMSSPASIAKDSYRAMIDSILQEKP